MYNQPLTPEQLRDPEFLDSLVFEHAKHTHSNSANDEPPSYHSEIPPYDEPKQHSNKKPKIGLSNGMHLYAPTKISWLIKDILEAGTLSGMFGASGSGKSFTAIDLALCVASGKFYHDHKVTQGGVVYFAGEGKAGLIRRTSAWLQSNPDYKDAIATNFYLADRACRLPLETNDVLDTLSLVPNLKLIVLDTLQRTFEGDENSTRDMSAYIQALDDIKANYPDIVILVIHHTGHSTSDRARGSSVLRASLDAEINVSMDDTKAITLKCSKMKDADDFKPLSFKLKSIPLDGWLDDDGYLIESAIVECLPDYQAQNSKGENVRKRPSGKNLTRALDMLESLYQLQRHNLAASGQPIESAQVCIDDWVSACVSSGITERAAYFKRDVQLKLAEHGYISLKPPYVLLD